jgi:hypothetical protein
MLALRRGLPARAAPRATGARLLAAGKNAGRASPPQVTAGRD